MPSAEAARGVVVHLWQIPPIEEVGKKLVVHLHAMQTRSKSSSTWAISATLLYDERHYMARPRGILEQAWPCWRPALPTSSSIRTFSTPAPGGGNPPEAGQAQRRQRNSRYLQERPQAIPTRHDGYLMGASFADKLERERLTAMLANIEFFQNRAMDEAQQLM